MQPPRPVATPCSSVQTARNSHLSTQGFLALNWQTPVNQARSIDPRSERTFASIERPENLTTTGTGNTWKRFPTCILFRVQIRGSRSGFLAATRFSQISHDQCHNDSEWQVNVLQQTDSRHVYTDQQCNEQLDTFTLRCSW